MTFRLSFIHIYIYLFTNFLNARFFVTYMRVHVQLRAAFVCVCILLSIFCVRIRCVIFVVNVQLCAGIFLRVRPRNLEGSD